MPVCGYDIIRRQAQPEMAVGHMTIDGLDEAVIARLQSRADQNGRSVEDEARAIITDAVQSDRQRFIDAADRMRAKLAAAGYWGDSTADLRADRDR